MKKGFLNLFSSLVKNPNFNVTFTFFVIVGCIYVTILSLFDRNIFDQSEIRNIKNETVNLSENNDNFKTVLSLFYLWLCALVFGNLASYLNLPPLLGMLIAGIFFNNVPGLKGFIVIDRKWEETCRQIAFLLILVRAGIGINPLILKKSFHHCFVLGFGSTTFEVLTVVFSSFYLFDVPLAVGISFGFILTATSPAITVPTMIKLQKEQHGAKKGVPTVVLASATMDNLFCISAFYIAAAIIFLSRNKPFSTTIMSVVGEMIASVLVGITAGSALQHFPKVENGFLHFCRGSLILSMALAVYYGTRNLGFFIIGPIVVFMMSTIATMKWKFDNANHTRIEERGFKILWVFLFLPLLFSLIGLLIVNLFAQFISVLLSVVVFTENKTENIPMKERIHGLIDHHSLMVFSKTYCPYSKLAKRILYEKYKIYPKHILELDEENNMTEIQDYLSTISGIRTVPQIYVNGEFVGGATDIQELDRQGKLKKILRKAKVL
uniref:Glutaredoxin domain-containing protein n=1 Tax=Panagrolaimus sp. JU765 TaxID=591449 RepID=A0AC34Q6U1_9BILA